MSHVSSTEVLWAGKTCDSCIFLHLLSAGAPGFGVCTNRQGEALTRVIVEPHDRCKEWVSHEFMTTTYAQMEVPDR